jgi:acetyl-CoA acyltransferase
VVSGGVESMSQIAMGGQKPSPNPELMDEHPEAYTPMGITAENVAERFHVSREDQDAFSYRSHRRRRRRSSTGASWTRSSRSTRACSPTARGNRFRFDRDEGPGPTRRREAREAQARVQEHRNGDRPDRRVRFRTARRRRVIAARDFAEANGLPILGVLKSYQVVGVPPEIMGVGPRYAIPKALEAAGLSIEDIDVFELNEAFASQALYCQRELGSRTTSSTRTAERLRSDIRSAARARA